MSTTTTVTTATPRRLHPVLRWIFGLMLLAGVIAMFITASVVSPAAIRAGVNTFAEMGLYFLALPAAALFVGLYMGFSSWRSTLPGRATATVGLALVGVLLVNASTLFFGQDYPAREWIRVVAYWGIGVAEVYLCYSVVHFQRLGLIERRRQRDEGVDGE